MKFGKIYSEATGNAKEAPPVVVNDESALTQLKIQWLSSEVTEEMFKKLNNEKQELIDRAIKLASTYSEHSNHMRIIDSLIRVDQINKNICQYSTLKEQ